MLTLWFGSHTSSGNVFSNGIKSHWIVHSVSNTGFSKLLQEQARAAAVAHSSASTSSWATSRTISSTQRQRCIETKRHVENASWTPEIDNSRSMSAFASCDVLSEVEWPAEIAVLTRVIRKQLSENNPPTCSVSIALSSNALRQPVCYACTRPQNPSPTSPVVLSGHSSGGSSGVSLSTSMQHKGMNPAWVRVGHASG